MAILDSTTDSTAASTIDGAMLEQFHSDAPGRRCVMFKTPTKVRSGHPADPGRFGFAKPAAGVALRPGGPEYPLT